MATTADTYPNTGLNPTTDVHTGTGPASTGPVGTGAGTGMNEKNMSGHRGVGPGVGTGTDTKYKYHPVLFAALFAFSLIELGLTAYLIHRGGLFGQYRSSIIFLLFNACWSTLGSLLYLLFISSNAHHVGASKGSAITWLTITAILWGVAAGLCTRSRPFFSGRRGIAAEAFAWIPFVITLLALIATVHRAGRVANGPTAGGYRSGYYV